MQCHRSINNACEKDMCMRWVRGASGEPGECMDNLETRFVVRLLNIVIKTIVPLAESFTKTGKKDE